MIGTILALLVGFVIGELIYEIESYRKQSKFQYVIFHWDHNGDPDEVVIDSICRNHKTAKKRMLELYDIANNITDENSPYSGADLQTLGEEPDGANIKMTFKPGRGDGLLDYSNGIYCKRVKVI